MAKKEQKISRTSFRLLYDLIEASEDWGYSKNEGTRSDQAASEKVFDDAVAAMTERIVKLESK